MLERVEGSSRLIAAGTIMGAGRAAEAGVVGVRGAALRAVTKASAKAAYFLADHERIMGFFSGIVRVYGCHMRLSDATFREEDAVRFFYKCY